MSGITIEKLVFVIFTKMPLIYGRDFTARWEGLNMEDVMADWAYELAGFEKRPSAIKFALQNLPVSKPPTVLEFRAIAQRAPDCNFVRIESPRATPAVMQAALDAAYAAIAKPRVVPQQRGNHG